MGEKEWIKKRQLPSTNDECWRLYFEAILIIKFLSSDLLLCVLPFKSCIDTRKSY